MKKLDNISISNGKKAELQQMCGPSTNCQSGGCSCSKCFDSTKNEVEIIKEIYNK